MSLISGLMLGASIGKAIHGMFLKNDHHGAHVLDFVSKSARTHRSGGARTRKNIAVFLRFRHTRTQTISRGRAGGQYGLGGVVTRTFIAIDKCE